MRSSAPALKWLSGLLAAVLIAYATVYQCFAERITYFDEAGLFNAVYTYLHYGKMTYPVHGQFDTMFVHPPTQYLLIATLMRLGLSAYHAGGLLSVILFAIFAAIVVSSRFEFPVQIAFLLGVFLGAFVWNEALVLRPDLTLTLAWIAGLAALETARLDDWNAGRLAVGGFFLALATGVHYVGIAAGIGLVAYIVAIWRSKGREAARKPILWMLGGAAVYAIPDLILFVVPQLPNIVAFSAQVEKDAPPGSAYHRQMEAYTYWRNAIPLAMPLRPVTTRLTEPLFRFSIPALFVAAPVLALFRATRVLAIAAVPQLAFILFVARHKQINYTGYFAAEIELYLVAIFLVIFTVVLRPFQYLKVRWAVMLAAIVITGGAVGIAAAETPALSIKRLVLTTGVYDFEAGRAAGRAMLGPGAVVGTSSAGVWYTSGAAHLYFVNPDIISPPSIECVDLNRYFHFFDAVAIDPFMSWIADNRERTNIMSSYVDRTLKLRGFFYPDRRGYYEWVLSYLLLAPKETHPLVGYGAKGEKMYRFEESPRGNDRFVAAVCPTAYGMPGGAIDNRALRLDFYEIYYRPISSNGDPQQDSDLNQPAAIITLIADSKRLERDIRPALARCRVIDEIPLERTELPVRKFIADSEKTDEQIHFYPDFAAFKAKVGNLPGREDLRAADGLPSRCNTTTDSGNNAAERPDGLNFPMPGALRLDSIALAYDKARIQGKSPVDVITAPQQWAYAASIPISLGEARGSRMAIHVRGRVLKGEIGLGVLDREAKAFQVEKIIHPAPDADYYIMIPSPERAAALIVRNASATGLASEMEIEQTGVLAAAHVVDNAVRFDTAVATEGGLIEKNAPLTIRTGAQQWAYAAIIPVPPAGAMKDIVIQVRAHVTRGEIGIGLLSADEKSFAIEQRYGESKDPVDVLLPEPREGGGRKLVIRNTAGGGTISRITIEKLTTWKLD
jgi:hypothetical protein